MTLRRVEFPSELNPPEARSLLADLEHQCDEGTNGTNLVGNDGTAFVKFAPFVLFVIRNPCMRYTPAGNWFLT